MRLYLHYLKPVFSRSESIVYIFYEAVIVITHSILLALGATHRAAVIADCGGVEVASHS